MKRYDLLARISDKTRYNREDIDNVLRAMTEVLKEEMLEGEPCETKIDWLYVGAKMSNPRLARNPKTGETVEVESKLRPYARVMPRIKKEVSGDIDESE